MIDRGDRWYNGIPCQLMNDIYDGLIARCPEIIEHKYWAVLSLYICRVCNVLENQGWKKE